AGVPGVYPVHVQGGGLASGVIDANQEGPGAQGGRGAWGGADGVGQPWGGGVGVRDDELPGVGAVLELQAEFAGAVAVLAGGDGDVRGARELDPRGDRVGVAGVHQRRSAGRGGPGGLAASAVQRQDGAERVVAGPAGAAGAEAGDTTLDVVGGGWRG